MCIKIKLLKIIPTKLHQSIQSSKFSYERSNIYVLNRIFFGASTYWSMLTLVKIIRVGDD